VCGTIAKAREIGKVRGGSKRGVHLCDRRSELREKQREHACVCTCVCISVCVCVCVCLCERERKRARMCLRASEIERRCVYVCNDDYIVTLYMAAL